MAGTKAGGQKAAATNKALHGSDFYAKIGAIVVMFILTFSVVFKRKNVL